MPVICTVTSCRDASMRPQQISWPILVAELERQRREGPSAKDGPGLVCARPKESVIGALDGQPVAPRKSASVAAVTVIALDIEDADYSRPDPLDPGARLPGDQIGALDRIEAGLVDAIGRVPTYYAYTTYNHGVAPKWRPDHPRLRLLIPLEREVEPDRAARIIRRLTIAIPGVDRQAIDPARIMYMPRPDHPEAQVVGWAEHYRRGRPLDADEVDCWCVMDDDAAPADALDAITHALREELTGLEDADHGIGLCFGPWFLACCHAHGPRSATTQQLLNAARAVPGVSLTELRRVVADYDPVGDGEGEQAAPEVTYQGTLGEDDLRRALARIDLPEHGARERWISVGMALKDYAASGKIPDATAYDLYHVWSASQPGYEDERDVATRWRSFDAGPVTIATLIHYAREGGWRPPRGAASVVGRADQGFVTGDEAELAATLLTRLGRPAADVVPVTFLDDDLAPTEEVLIPASARTIVYSHPTVWRWDVRRGLWRAYTEAETTVAVSAWSGAEIVGGKNTRLLRISSRTGPGVHRMISEHVSHTSAVGAAWWARPSRDDGPVIVGSVATEDGVILLGEDGDYMLADDHPSLKRRWRCPASITDPGTGDWSAFLDSVFPGQPDRVAALQEYVGATLLGFAHSLQRVCLLVGGGANGKGTFIRAVLELFDREFVTYFTPQQLSETSREGLHKLLDAALNVGGDIDRRDLEETGLFKRITGGDEVAFGVKYKPEPATGTVRAGHIWSMNDYPIVRDRTAGFWRRWLIVPFEQRFTIKGATNLDAKLRADLPSVLRWALEGARRLVGRGMQIATPAAHEHEKEKWQVQTNSVHAFARELRDDGERMKAVTSYRDYRSWCRDSGYHPCAKLEFYQRMKALADAGHILRVNLSGTQHYGLARYVEPAVDARAWGA